MTAGILANVLGPDGLIVVIVIVVVLLFGGSQLPKLARGLGSASHEFRKGLEEGAKPTAPEDGAESPTTDAGTK